MGTAEFNDGSFGDPKPLSEKSLRNDLLEDIKQANAKVAHVGLMEELDRHKQVMESIKNIQDDIKMIKKHFNIVPIIGNLKKEVVE